MRSDYSMAKSARRGAWSDGEPPAGFEPVPLPEAMKGIELPEDMGELHQMVMMILDGEGDC